MCGWRGEVWKLRKKRVGYRKLLRKHLIGSFTVYLTMIKLKNLIHRNSGRI